MANLALDVRKEKNLNKAWKYVYRKRRFSGSPKSRQEAIDFSTEEYKYIKNIQKDLREERHQFISQAYAIQQAGKKKPRPINIFSIQT